MIHFLNAILGTELRAPLTEADIPNPYNDKEFLDDKLSIVDVKAGDRDGRIYQIEIQLLNYGYLPARMLYNWADIYSQQLQSGRNYHHLRPTYGIWLLAENLIADDAEHVHAYKLRDSAGRTLIEHGGIWVLELAKFTADRIDSEEQRWLKFFKEGEQLDDTTLPEWMNTHEMRQAMNTLKIFSEKDRDYHAYQARQNFLREQHAILMEREEAQREREQAFLEREQAFREREQAQQELELERTKGASVLAEKDVALAEIERLKALLEQR